MAKKTKVISEKKQSNSHNSRGIKLDAIVPWIRAAAGIVTIASILMVVLEYRQNGEIERAKSAMKFIDDWEEKGYRRQYKYLTANIEEILSTVSKQELKALQQSSLEIQLSGFGNLGKKSYQNSEDNSQAKAAVEDLFYFFTKMVICVDTGVCSERVIRAFYEEPTYSFWLYFNWYSIIQRNQYNSNHGTDIETFVLRE